jgi:hypothetical protein
VKGVATQSTNVHVSAHTAAKQLSANAASEQKQQQADKAFKTQAIFGCVGEDKT